MKNTKFRETQLKLIEKYLKQPKPPMIKIHSGSMALRYSMKVLLHPNIDQLYL